MRERNRTRWGILGTGRIAGTFAEALAHLPDAVMVAVGSRAQASADRFAQKHGIPRAWGSYEALVQDADVDVVYVASPHTEHPAHVLLCLDQGRAVLCEKPFSLNELLSRTMIDRAAEKKLFLMEAMWTRFLPAMQRFLELVEDGAIGEPRTLIADFGFAAPFDPASRLYDPLLGGGALLDVGIYPVSLACRIFGEPEQVDSSAHLGPTGVDHQSACILKYPGGAQAVLSFAVATQTGQEACLYGTRGHLKIESPWWCARRLILNVPGREPRVLDVPFEGNGYTHEAVETMRCLNEGLLESPRMTWENTLAIARTLDRIRAPWGLRYPQELTETASGKFSAISGRTPTAV